jgi:hypothetical protein
MSKHEAQTPTTPDNWAQCKAATLAGELERLDKLIFHYPRILETAGKVRAAISETIRELEEHAQ